MSVFISRCKVRGDSRWRVRWHDTGKVRRKFFTSRDSADAHAAKIRGELVGVRQLLASIPQHEQEKLVMVHNEAKRRGVDVLAFLQVQTQSPVSSLALDVVIKEMLDAKRSAGRNERYIDCLGWILNGFATGREKMPIERVGLADVDAYLRSKNLISRSCYRGRLSTLFNYAVRKGYMAADPCRRLEPITVTRPSPAVMTVDEVRQSLKWLQVNPRIFGWFVLSTFAGLRPEEAEKTTWADINFKEGWIRVEAQTTKVRQRRVVYPKPMVFKWLLAVKKHNVALPVSRNIRSDDLGKLRAAIGWKVWKQDCTRHSCASYWLSDTGDASTVATALGHPRPCSASTTWRWSPRWRLGSSGLSAENQNSSHEQ